MSDAGSTNAELESPVRHLRNAPIVEAVIHWQARVTKPWQVDELRTELARRLPEYSRIVPSHLMELEFAAQVGDSELPTANKRETWVGLRLQTPDRPYIAQFTRDGLAFSRLRPYEDWERFAAEGQRLWNVFALVGAPTEIQRLGVRFINRIPAANFDNLKHFLREPPSLTADFPLRSFSYQSRLAGPDDGLEIGVGKAMQPTIAGQEDEGGLIIDIDVFTTKPLSCDERILDEYLAKLRALKNSVFFGLLTPQAIEGFQ